MVNPLIGTLALTPAEQAINFLIQDDPHLADLIEPFTGKLLEVETRQPAATFTVLFESGRIRLSSLEGAMTGVHPDAKVRTCLCPAVHAIRRCRLQRAGESGTGAVR